MAVRADRDGLWWPVSVGLYLLGRHQGGAPAPGQALAGLAERGMFLGGHGLCSWLATQSGIGAYDDVLFYDHMVQHLMLLMVAPPLLIAGQPLTLLLHASRNPLHTWTKRVLRSPVASFLTWPVFGAVAYALAVLAAHLTSLATTSSGTRRLTTPSTRCSCIVGYLFYLPILGREPIRWRLSYPIRFVILVLLMPVDTFTGIALGYGSVDLAGRAGRTAPGVGPERRSTTCTWAAR